MSSIQATRLKKGNLIVLDGELYRILELQHVTPGNLAAVGVSSNIRNATAGPAALRDVIGGRPDGSMRYAGDSSGHHFMDTKTYDQITLSDEVLGDMVGYLVPESTIKVEFYGRARRLERRPST
jgi:elongation factor P